MEQSTEVGSHFAFGENWASYAQLVTEEHVGHAVLGLRRLFGDDGLRGKSFLDIGCGSGIHAVAALRLGCRRVLAIDIDETSVATAHSTLRAFAPPTADFDARPLNVFDADPASIGHFDVVYSWGVLHHTGQMWRAVDKAAALVGPAGVLGIALYHKTPLCPFWRIEKRLYSRAPRAVQDLICSGYVGLYRLKCAVVGKNFHASIDSYKQERGMDFRHDVHDWLGGYPYESASPTEVRAFFARAGFALLSDFSHAPGFGFTVRCDEYVFQRQ